MRNTLLFVCAAVVLVVCIPVLAKTFPDVPEDHWAYDAVEQLASAGVVVGYVDMASDTRTSLYGAAHLMLRSQINVRDPFVLPVKENGVYYLYGTGRPAGSPVGFYAYRSRSLEYWEGPIPVFLSQPGFWADRDYWAPEVYLYRGRLYMFASFKAEGVHRGTQILTADGPEGPFRPHSIGPVTPRDWECLDGTLFIDEENAPWMVFCHEWTQVHDGEICAIRLTPDLTASTGKPILLFRATEAPWVTSLKRGNSWVTDGPFLYRTTKGTLLMLWSSFSNGKYALGIARSSSGKIQGPWVQDKVPLYSNHGGHGMVFTTFDGWLMLAIHAPNSAPERPLFLPIEDTGDSLRLR